MLLARAQMMDPPRKNAMESNREFRLPSTSAKPPMSGWKAVTVSKNEEVIHVGEMVEVGRSLTMVGSAVLMIVRSMAERNMTMANVAKMNQNCMGFLCFGCRASSTAVTSD